MTKINRVPTRQQLWRFSGWFFLLNTILSFLTQLSYLHLLPNLNVVAGATTDRIILAWLFMFASYITQALTINFFSCAIVLVIVWIWPRYWLTALFAVLLATLFGVGQIVDVVTFKLFHTHNITMAWRVYKAGAFMQVLPLSAAELGLMVSMFIGFLLLESLLALLIWRRIQKNPTSHLGKKIAVAMLLLVAFSYSMMAAVLTLPANHRLNPHNARLLLKVARFVPYFTDVYTLLVPHSEVYIRHANTHGGMITMQTQQMNQPLNYPQQPLVCHAHKPPLNIVFLLIDTWRYDAMTSAITPNIFHFAQQTQQFQDTYSGGNCTQPGIFSLFYSIPANYWKATEDQHVGPVFIKELQKQGYQMGIFGSATLKFPEFEKNVFVDVPDLKTETAGKGSIGRDKTITKEFARFIKQRNPNKPFFSFMFYDAAHDYCGGGPDAHQVPFTPAIKYCKRYSLTVNSNPAPYVNRYHNAVHAIDKQVGADLALLKQQGLLKNTIVVITADHGTEFNDEHLNYWSHASAYTPYQLHVPMIVWWPGKGAHVYHHFTTLFDVAPTLLHQVLGCPVANPIYTVGHSLFSAQPRHYIVAGSYGDYAVVQKHRIVRIYPGGDYVINHPDGHHYNFAKLNPKTMDKAYHQVMMYFRKGG